MMFGLRIKNIIFILLGSAIFSFGLVHFNMQNNLSEGGFTGITLIFYFLWGWIFAITDIILNILLYFIGKGYCDHKYHFRHSFIFCRLEVSMTYYFGIYSYSDICILFLFKYQSNSPVFHNPAGYDISNPFRGFVY